MKRIDKKIKNTMPRGNAVFPEESIGNSCCCGGVCVFRGDNMKMTYKIKSGKGTFIIPDWFVKKENLDIIESGKEKIYKIISETEKAYLIIPVAESGELEGEVWIPKSILKDEGKIEFAPYMKNFAKKDNWAEFKNRLSASYSKNPKAVKDFWEENHKGE